MPTENQVFLIGHLAADPELRYGQSGTAYSKFTLVTNRFVPGQDSVPDFHRCTAFSKTAEFLAENAKKGSLVYVNGSLQYGSYDKEDGTRVYTTDIIVQRAFLLRDTGDGGSGGGSKPASRPKSTLSPEQREAIRRNFPGAREVA